MMNEMSRAVLLLYCSVGLERSAGESSGPVLSIDASLAADAIALMHTSRLLMANTGLSPCMEHSIGCIISGMLAQRTARWVIGCAID